MEEVDRILIQSLRDIGCQIDDSLQNVNELNVNTLLGCVSQCLQLITGNKELPTHLPPNISTRFKVCGELAQLCQSNGYKGDIGYQIFLSINEHETRKLLNCLIEKVPREDPWEALERILSNKIISQLSDSTWVPHDLVIDLCNIPTYHPAGSFPHKSLSNISIFYSSSYIFIFKNDDLLLTQSRFMHTNIVEQQSNGFDENPKRNIDHTEELETLKTTINENDEIIHQLELQLQKLEERHLLLNDIKDKDEQLIRLQNDYEKHKSTKSKNDHSRTFFTKQILEIVKNTNKQKRRIK
ncbi:unnamed protein product [Rotaria sordida]|uniref:CCDC22 N-terminal domain-containing protein n=1 Tax=Rotaria sordida TaxID=392033 RepID=A0A815FUV2_9BILA|nr:unnamed protein product [Rotaria sordida]